ncbi:MAG: UDP-N-acetylmuramoyl-L-alanyl-D-glutamate--2,6-diaminopimelate ligase [Holosporales bacterium]|nr:UDP-N-acetylmuramoyl-L-alanyl-D-glutamate--2,6-diaminopimelate ligase [Holosporales bacterium]
MKILGELLGGLVYSTVGNDDHGALSLEVSGVCLHSSNVFGGVLFVAIPGNKYDGFSYVDSAIAGGAGAILCSLDRIEQICGSTAKDRVFDPSSKQIWLFRSDNNGVVFLFSVNVRKTLSQIVSHFYDRTSADVIGVTGTDGKSSVVDFLRQLWFLNGHASASIGTLGVLRGGEKYFSLSSHIATTPDVISLCETVKSLANEGINKIAIEASSHGLDQHRIDGINFKVACFTNLSHDHLDYHGNMDRYLLAKKRLFSEILNKDGVAIINLDSPQAPELIDTCRVRKIKVINYGRSCKADIHVKNVKVELNSQTVQMSVFGKTYSDVRIPLAGDFQIYNTLCTIATLSGMNDADELSKYIALLPNLKGVPGRMEFISSINDAAVYVDFAHTPEGFVNILSTLRPRTHSKLKILFGCGGDRDKRKRPLMGKTACEMADEVFITDDNPRSEFPEQIRREILAGGSKMLECPDRKEAIMQALKTLKPGDVLVIAGKGHEQFQIFKDYVVPFNDADVIRACVAELSQ